MDSQDKESLPPLKPTKLPPEFKPDICIYHDGCDDGYAAAFAVWSKWGDDIEFHAARYQDAPPDVNDKSVLIVDFSYKHDVMEDMINKAWQLIVYDHHKSAIKDLKPLVDNSSLVYSVFDESRSGCVITWEQLFDLPVPKLLLHIEDRDLWRFRLAHTEEISAGLQIEEKSFIHWGMLCKSDTAMDTLRRNGMAILAYHHKLCKSACNNARENIIGGHPVLSANCPRSMASKVGNMLAENRAFGVTWHEDASGHRNYELRSIKNTPKSVDVSVIAEHFGGGGHKHAAGFKLPSAEYQVYGGVDQPITTKKGE